MSASGLTERTTTSDTRAWIVVASAFLSMFTVFGVAYSFGAFFGPMAEEFGTDRGATALFFSLTTFLYFALGVVSGRAADRYGPRPVLVFGALAMSLGLLATSQVNSIWVGYVTYGIGVGIGVACGYVPMVAVVGGWFQENRTTALGVAVAGIGMGTLIMAPVTERLVDANGWRNTYVVLAVGSGVLLLVAAVGAHAPPQVADGPPAPPLLQLIGSSTPFWVLYISMFLLAFALFAPFVFLADFLDEREISGSAGLLVGLIGLSSVVGRLGLGALANRFPALMIYRGSIAVLGASFALWLVAGDWYLALMAFAIVLGLAYGGFIALAPAVTANVFGTVGLGGVLGALYTSAGLGGLLGPPVIGWLIDRAGYGWAITVAMAVALSSSAVLATIERGNSSH